MAKSNVSFDFSGVQKAIAGAESVADDELLKKMAKAYKQATEGERAELFRWFNEIHRRNHGGKHVADAWMDGKATYSKGKLSYVFGYDVHKTLVPIFLEYGTPRIQPEFYMREVGLKVEDSVEDAFVAVLHQMFKAEGLMD